MKNKRKLGFTLVELLVVMTIIGILTMITASNFVEVQKKSRDVKRKADLASISKALNMYYDDYGKFPSIDNLLTSGGDFVNGTDVYMKQIPTEKSNNVTRYTYFVSGTGKSFRLWANLENNSDNDCKSAALIKDIYNLKAGTLCGYAVYSSNVGVGTSLF
jgi:prepilin-type N-terminal cleavage/methylation domain-containing protein